ncbi:MAG: hypothetical protein C3F02_02190 [Parcubacteria group bacterium]|nr:MAG: hypothetical protein C3F02_02190 [Parcubacteria group bacterium]
MDHILTLRDKDIFPGYREQKIDYVLREASRGVVFDFTGKIAALFVAKDGYYKLAGGGLESGENKLSAMVRECLEETGCYIHNLQEIGLVEEWRDKYKLHQKSYCFIAEVKGEKGQTNFDAGETADGFRLDWLGFDQALKVFSGQSTDSYEGKFIIRRDLAILQKAKELYGKK